MKQKYLNNVKVILILLFVVTILFAILGTFKLLPNKEGMDDYAPQCSSLEEDTDSDEYSNYHSDDLDINDNYMLKTKMVIPTSTSCPMKISSNASNYLDSVGSLTETSSSNTESTSSTTESTESNTVSTNNAPINNVPIKNEPINNEPIATPSPTMNSSSSPFDGYMLNDKKKENDSCPPCPACERCPEPAFDCKKVPNYRSPSIGSYLPMPILTDFSKF